MSKALAEFAKAAQRTGGKRMDLPEKGTPGDAKALAQIRKEAAGKGSYLASGGKGGLPSKLVLGVMQRDKYRCKRCGREGDKKKNGGISIHHKGGIAASKWLSKKGHHNVPDNFATLCVKCHDAIHEEARDDGTDSSQVTPKGDVGTHRDEGKPVANP